MVEGQRSLPVSQSGADVIVKVRRGISGDGGA